MEWIRRNPKKTAGLSALAVLAMVILAWGLAGGSGSPGSATLGGPPLATPTTTPTDKLTALPSPSDTGLGHGLGQLGSKAYGSSFDMPGLPGHGLYAHLPRHRLVIKVFSEQPIGTVGYIIPTSLRKYYGVDKRVGPRWSLTTSVYGDPDYAQVFLQAGARGYPITCVITVDGRQTERRSTEGPYGQTMCQG